MTSRHTEEQGRASVVLSSSHSSYYPFSYHSVIVLNTWYTTPASTGTAFQFTILKVSLGVPSGARVSVFHLPSWWCPHCQLGGKLFSSKPHLIFCFLGSLLVPVVTHWILQKQVLRWSLGCVIFLRDLCLCKQDWTAELWASPVKALSTWWWPVEWVLPIRVGLQWLGLSTTALLSTRYGPCLKLGEWALQLPQILKELTAGDSLLSTLCTMGGKSFLERWSGSHICVYHKVPNDSIHAYFARFLFSISRLKLHAYSVLPPLCFHYFWSLLFLFSIFNPFSFFFFLLKPTALTSEIIFLVYFLEFFIGSLAKGLLLCCFRDKRKIVMEI